MTALNRLGALAVLLLLALGLFMLAVEIRDITILMP